ncbi:hypothetical protein AB0G32_34960 [Streptomyces sp. NPDC023723]|uniref:hypothetical protein n=1 Tax=Streptomyces sp. NPDC023723 TaxID=3154323 RepID=UPI0034012703
MGARTLPALPQYRKDGVTRRLCAAVHLDEQFARWADRELTGDRLTSPGLTLGINFVALARHARAAVVRRDTLDRQLTWLAAALGAALLTAGWGLAAGLGSVAVVGIYGPLAVLGASWWLIHRAESQARDAARAVFLGTGKAEALAPPVRPEAEAWLHELKRANALPYADAAALTTPFVGSGTKIKEVVWQPVDVSRPAEAPGGGTLPLRPFDAVDLHTYVAREMESIAGLAGLRARNRLYVIGSHAHLLPELVPDRTARPRAQLPKQLVQAGLLTPGAGMRTHLCLERVGEGGRVVVSMYLRAILHRPHLTWEVAAYVIPPLDGRFDRVDRLPVAPFDRWWSLVGYATSRLWPDLRGAPGRRRARRRRARQDARALARRRREITDQHLLVDHGADGSVRARLGDWAQAGYAERIDAQDYLFRLQQGVLVATERFLKDHHVDTSSFDRARQVISTQTYHISGDITGPSNIGTGGQITVNGPPGPQGPGGPAAAQGQGGPTP